MVVGLMVVGELYQISLMLYYYAPTDILLTSLFTIAFLI